jgi:DNA polymerase-1
MGFEFIDGCYQTDHLAVAFDNGGSQLRNEIFPEYKAHRDATPEY